MKRLLIIFLVGFFLAALSENVWAAPAVPPNKAVQGNDASNPDTAAPVYSGVLKSTPWYDQNYPKLRDKVKECETTANFECYNLAGFMSGLTNIAVAGIGLTDDKGTPLVAGATGFLAGGIDYMASTPPASSLQYIAYLNQKIAVPGMPQTAYAAGNGGTGFNRLGPILPIWSAMRNLAYLVFAIIFIVIGLMIMFRMKIDPKTVANIQNSLPRIIWALVLVTFSFAIAGLLIDLMYVLLSLILTIGKEMVPIGGRETMYLFEKLSLTGGSVFNLFGPGSVTVGVASLSIFQIVQSLFQAPILGSTGANSLFAGGVSTLAFVFLVLVLLYSLFKTWLMLLGAYTNIILGIIFAPLQLMMEAVPGQNQFGNWLKSMAANLLAFPLVIIMLLISLVISVNILPQLTLNSALKTIPFGIGDFLGGSLGAGWVPPLIGGNDANAAAGLVALGILFTIPRALDILKETFKTPAFKYGNAWMETITGAYKSPAGNLAQAGAWDYGAQQWRANYGNLPRTIQNIGGRVERWAVRNRKIDPAPDTTTERRNPGGT